MKQKLHQIQHFEIKSLLFSVKIQIQEKLHLAHNYISSCVHHVLKTFKCLSASPCFLLNTKNCTVFHLPYLSSGSNKALSGHVMRWCLSSGFGISCLALKGQLTYSLPV